MMRSVPIALALALFVEGCSHAHVDAQDHPTPVKVKTVERAPDATLARFSGSLEPAVKVEMAFRVGGYVEALGQVTDNGKTRSLEEGDFVKKGSLLARVRAADYAQKVATAKATVSQAQSDAKLADVELERSKKLFESKAISKSEYDAKVARAESARANVDGAIARSGEAGVALDDTVLRAPMDGVVLARTVEIGALVSPGAPVITVADTRTVKAVFAVPQQLVEKLRLGGPLEVYLEGTKPTAAKVTRIAPSADSKGRVFSIESELANEAGALRPGTVIAVHVPDVTLSSGSTSVPLSAVVRAPNDPRGFAVYVLDGNRVRLQQVKLGEVLGNAVTVTDGLALGQRVVTVGATLVRDGSPAVVIP